MVEGKFQCRITVNCSGNQIQAPGARMWLRAPTVLELGSEPAGPEELLSNLPASPAVYLFATHDSVLHLGSTRSLRRRVQRLLRPGSLASRLFGLNQLGLALHYWLVGSSLEAMLGIYELARQHFPEDYRSRFRLRPVFYLQLLQGIRFPRTQVTRRLRGSRSLYFGPFRTRHAAENFESELLNFFQIRRCREDFEPSPEHPGCIYGEMNRCLRPCQAQVSEQEYRAEVQRVAGFLRTRGQGMLRALVAAREQASQTLDFEQAAYHHATIVRLERLLRQLDELAADVEHLHGVAVTPSVHSTAVELWFMVHGVWVQRTSLDLSGANGAPVPLGQRLREILEQVQQASAGHAEREEHVGILASWYYAHARDGDWVRFEDFSSFPYRKVIAAARRVLADRRPAASPASA